MPLALPSSNTLLGNAVVIDMEFAATGLTGVNTGGGYRGKPGKGLPAGSKAGKRRTTAPLKSYEVDRLPRCPKLKPAYPQEAKRQELEGDVVLRLQIGVDGRVKRASVKRKTGQGFDAAAMAAARKMRCKPAIRDGEPVAVWIDYEIAFRFMD